MNKYTEKVLNREENKEFFEKLAKVWKETLGSETFGTRTEFYDEDGILIMSYEEQGENLLFTFGIDDEYLMPRKHIDENASVPS